METEQNRLALEKARNLIKAKKYKQAIEILNTVDSPTAKQWIEKLQSQIQSQNRNNTSNGQSLGLIAILVFVVGILLGGIAGFFIGRQSVLNQIASIFAGSTAFSSPSTVLPNTSSDTDFIAPAATIGLEEQIITRIVNAYTFDPIDLKAVAATDTDIYLEIRIDEMSSLTLLGGSLEGEIVDEMVRTICVLHDAEFLQTYNIDALISVADDFGQDEYSVVASARLEPETREKLDCSNPYEINLPAIADEWTILESNE